MDVIASLYTGQLAWFKYHKLGKMLVYALDIVG